MRELILAKFGEVALKGLNRSHFEKVLTTNVKKVLAPIGKFDITTLQSTVYILPIEGQDNINEKMKKAKMRVQDVFGFAGISTAAEANKDINDIGNVAIEYLKDKLSSAKTFKVEAKRSDKKFPLKSPEICREIGGQILSKFNHLRVDVHNPDVVVMVEIRDLMAYVHSGKENAAGGLPVGTSGKATLLLSGGIDSPVAGYMMARRGISLSAVYFSTPPYTSERATQKVVALAQLISRYAGDFKLFVVPFTKVQEEIAKNCPSDMFTLILRRFMMRAAERITLNIGGKALITGESLGQVASQTISAINVTGSVVNMPVFQPLIGMDKEEITRISVKIGTFETSILPYEDCCSLFSPRHPKTNPKIYDAENAEKGMNIEALIEESVAGAKAYYISYDGSDPF